MASRSGLSVPLQSMVFLLMNSSGEMPILFGCTKMKCGNILIRVKSRMESKVVKGSCLCGEVSYEIIMTRINIVMAVCCLAGNSTRAAPPKTVVKKLPIKGEAFSIEGRTAFLILPAEAKAGHPTPWLWYAPTVRGLPGKAEKWMFDRFLDKGIAIAGVDVGESYGSPKGRAIYSALYKELVEGRGLAKQACLLARSRGGLMLYNWAVENPDSVVCVAGIYPVCNLSSYPGLNRACGAYGMTTEQLADKLAEHNPIDRLAPLAKAKVPIFHIHGDSDKVVPLEKNSAELAKRYGELGGKMTLNIVKGQGHNMWPGWFQCQELVDFMIAHAGEERPNKPDAGDCK